MERVKFFLLTIFTLTFILGQDEEKEKFHFEFEMDSLEIHVGETKEVTIKLLNEDGDLAQNQFYVFGQRRALSVSPRMSDSTGVATVTLKAHKPGRLRLSVRNITVDRDDRVRDRFVVNVPYPSVEKIVFTQIPNKLYTGTSTPILVEVIDEAQLTRSDINVDLKSSDPKIANIDAFGNLDTKRIGKVTISATVEGLTEQFNVRVVKNPTRRVTLSADKNEIRTGDVLHFEGKALNRVGREVKDAPVSYS
ncbi:hypothetical protein JYT44_03250, partial [Caldithrix abyssi]|nr:hypothetical protein [Caldithrix abyssi]